MHETRQLRIARNHALFREVNERIWETLEEFGAHPAEDGLRLAFVCECGDGECTGRLFVTQEKYEDVRRTPARLLVLPGHERSELEDVVEENAGYLVVETHALAEARP